MSSSYKGIDYSLWNWEGTLLSHEDLKRDDNRRAICLTVDPPVSPEYTRILTSGPKYSRPIICVEGKRACAGLWNAYEVAEDGRRISCVFSHTVKSTCEEMWGENVHLRKEPHSRCLEDNIRLHKGPYEGDRVEKVYLAPPLIFHTRVSVFNIDSVDTVNQTFRADLFCELRLRNVCNMEDTEAVLELMECYSCNIKHVDFLHISEYIGEREVWTSFSSGTLRGGLDFVIKIRMKASFNEKMELMDFPFDMQELNLPLTFNTPASRVVLLVNDEYPSIFQVNSFQLSSIFEVVYSDMVMAETELSHPSESSAGTRYPRCVFTLYLYRKSGYYISNVILPMGVLTALAPMSCAVNEDNSSIETADRLSITLTLILTAVAYKFVVASSLPTVPYLTMLDVYVLTCFLFMCVNALENVFYPALVIHGATKFHEWIFVTIYYSCFSIYNIMFAGDVLVWYISRKRCSDVSNLTERVKRHVARLLLDTDLSRARSDAGEKRKSIVNEVLQERGLSSAAPSLKVVSRQGIIAVAMSWLLRLLKLGNKQRSPIVPATDDSNHEIQECVAAVLRRHNSIKAL